jgi:ADP-heptose:LPS heptosyltransferase
MAVIPRPDDPSSGALCVAAGVPVRVGFAMPRTRPFLTHALLPPGRTHVALMTHAVLAAGLAVFGAPPLPRPGGIAGSVRPTLPDQREADRVLASAGAGPRPVVLHPGSGWPLKNWPAGRWGEVARRLRQAAGTRVLVAGTAGETALAGEAAAASGGAAVAIAGLLSVGGLAALHARARLVIGVDSGALHLAAAVGTPTVALYGPGDPVQYAAAGAGHRVVRSGLPCSPCGTLERPPCGAVTDPACLTGVPASAVVAAALALLGRPATVRD